MAAVNDTDKAIARAAAAAFGGHPTVARFWDDNKRSFIDLLTATDAPQKGVSAFSTIGLSAYPVGLGNRPNLGVEIVAACGSNFRYFDNALSTAAFCVINSGWVCKPGAIFPDVLKMYAASDSMRHLAFFPPFLWEGKLETLHFPERTVAWLLAVPISDGERQFSEREGADALESLFEEKQIDIFNLARPSVV